jgi:hypothetical protein
MQHAFLPCKLPYWANMCSAVAKHLPAHLQTSLSVFLLCCFAGTSSFLLLLFLRSLLPLRVLLRFLRLPMLLTPLLLLL